MTTSELPIEADAPDMADIMAAAISNAERDMPYSAARDVMEALTAAGFTITRAASQQEMPEGPAA